MANNMNSLQDKEKETNGRWISISLALIASFYQMRICRKLFLPIYKFIITFYWRHKMMTVGRTARKQTIRDIFFHQLKRQIKIYVFHFIKRKNFIRFRWRIFFRFIFFPRVNKCLQGHIQWCRMKIVKHNYEYHKY